MNAKTNENNRIKWVDIAKFICISFVIIHHWGSEEEGLIRPLWLDKFYEPFFLTGFCFLSGFTYKFKEGFKDHVFKKFKQLIIPFLIYGLSIILLGYIITLHPENHTSLLTEIIQHFIQVRFVYGQLWFLAALFVAYIPFYFIIKTFNKKSNNKKLIIIAIVLFVLTDTYWLIMPNDILPWGSNALPWHIDYVPMELCFMIFGCLFKTNYDKYTNYINLKNALLVLCLYILVLFLIGQINLYLNLILNIIINIIKYTLATMSLVMVSHVIKPNKFNLFVGSNTLNYFAMHGKAQQAIQLIIKKIMPGIYTKLFTNEIFGIVFLIVFTFILSLILIIPSYIVDRYFPFILGKTKK